ncbi:hypothetical protein Tco_1281470, partial [Tanacetum coccineum]
MGIGVDWTGHEAEIETETSCLMLTCNSGSDTEVKSCSKECVESYAKLKKLYDEQREQLGDASIEIQAYTQALKKVEAQLVTAIQAQTLREQLGDASIEIQSYTLALKKVEAQLVAHQQNQLWYKEKIRFMKIDLDDKTNVLTYHKKLLAEALKEKEDLKTKFQNWKNSSKRFDGILSYENEVLQSVFMNKDSNTDDRTLYDRFVIADGIHAVPPPMIGNYIPSGPDIKIDESQFTYGPKQSKTSESNTQTSEYNSCDSDSSNSKPKVISEPMPEPAVIEPKVVSQSKVWTDAPIIEEYESDSDNDYVPNVPLR